MPVTPRNAMEGQLNHTLNIGVVPVHVRFRIHIIIVCL